MAANLYYLYLLGIIVAATIASFGVAFALISGDWRGLLAAVPFALIVSNLLNPRG